MSSCWLDCILIQICIIHFLDIHRLYWKTRNIGHWPQRRNSDLANGFQDWAQDNVFICTVKPKVSYVLMYFNSYHFRMYGFNLRGWNFIYAVLSWIVFFAFKANISYSVKRYKSGDSIKLKISIFICQVLHPRKWANLGKRWQRFLLFTAWMLGALLALPVVFSLIKVKTEDKCTDGYSCNNRMITPALQIVYVLFIVFSQIVLLSFYLLLVRRVSQTQMPDRKPLRSTKIIITIIVVSLVVCFIPLILRVVHVSVFFTADKVHHISKILTFAECFYFFKHCLNPFLYFFASRLHNYKSNTTSKSASHPLMTTSKMVPAL